MNPARLVFPALRWGDRDLEAVWPEVRTAVELGVGGFVVFGGSVTFMQSLVGRALKHAGRPLLFAADLERGAGQQLREATSLPPAAALAGLEDAGLIEAARLTAQEALSAGVGWVLAPVCDLDIEPRNPIVGTRSFGSQALWVADRVRAWVLALQGEGALACAKHFPGHGRTVADSHAELPVVAAPREELEIDLAPFREAIEARVRSVMMAHVSYPALDPSGTPASLSAPIIKLLREELEFGGLVATDAMIMDAIAAAGRTPAQAAVEAVRAGCDVLLYPASAEATVVALNEALAGGVLEEERVAAAVRHVEAAAASVTLTRDDELLPVPSHARALELAVASLRSVHGSVPLLRAGQELRVHIVDDDEVGALGGGGRGPAAPPANRGYFLTALAERGAQLIEPEVRKPACDIIAVYSDVKGWKGRAGLAPESVARVKRILDRALDATLVLFAHPRLAEPLGAATQVLCAWSGEPLMQEAVAERLLRAPGA